MDQYCNEDLGELQEAVRPGLARSMQSSTVALIDTGPSSIAARQRHVGYKSRTENGSSCNGDDTQTSRGQDSEHQISTGSMLPPDTRSLVEAASKERSKGEVEGRSWCIKSLV